MVRLFALVTLLCALPARAAAPPPPSADDARFDQLVDGYYQAWAARNPIAATGIGWHEHDGELPDMSAAGAVREGAELRAWDARLAALNVAALSKPRALDLAMLRLSIASSLVELEEVQGWRRYPDSYPSTASSSVYAIMKRSFAPADARLRSVTAREAKIPALLGEARKNLRGVSKVAVEIALEELPGIIDFFKTDVPSAFTEVKDEKLLAAFAANNAAVQKALAIYGEWLRKELLPKANGSLAIGESLYKRKLHADEMIDTPLDELLARGERELARLQAEYKATAAKIDPTRSYTEVQREMQKEHPAPDHIIADTQARLAGLRRFLVEHGIVSVPSEVMPRVQETPPFMRATTFASMDTPGAFETHATEAFYNVTLPEKSWPAAQVEDFLRGAYNRPLIDVVSIHEAFPGHYTQFLWMPHLAAGKVRKVESVSSNAEGWAHYCEQMLLDEGYGGGDPKLRLAQLQDALLRAARFVVGIRLHTRGMSFDDAVALFEKQGFQSRKVAEMETKRGTEDPTYLYYTLGKLEILQLREDYKKKMGKAYSLRKFHDAFLAEGALPLPLVRRALLAE